MVLSRGSATAPPTSTSASQTPNAPRWPTAWPPTSLKAGVNQAEFDERVAQAMNATTRGDLSGLFDDLPEPGPAGTPGTPVRGQHSPAHPVRHYANPFSLVLLVVVITAVGTAGEAASREGWLPGVKTWLTIGVITAIVVYAAGMLSRSRAARDK